MVHSRQRQYSRCFISAPYGIDLGVLPLLLGERQIAWNWGEDTLGLSSYASKIQRCDFMIAALNGSESDQRVLYEMGLAEGLGKAVFIIWTIKRIKAFPRFLPFVANVELSDREALSFHLDAFLSTPHEGILVRENLSARSTQFEPNEPTLSNEMFHSQLEARVYAAIISAGGSAIVEPESEKTGRRPDMLMWLGSQDAELFDPAVIEIKGHIRGADARRVEQQLFEFIQTAGVGCGLILTEKEPPQKRRPHSPYVFWLSVDLFTALASDRQLGKHIRNLRNRAAHGAE